MASDDRAGRCARGHHRVRRPARGDGPAGAECRAGLDVPGGAVAGHRPVLVPDVRRTAARWTARATAGGTAPAVHAAAARDPATPERAGRLDAAAGRLRVDEPARGDDG